MLLEKERRLLEGARGRVVLFHLSGPMIFGVAQAIARESAAAMEPDSRVIILDLGEVSMFGTTVALALENVIVDARQAGREVIVSGAPEEARGRLERLEVMEQGVEFLPDRRSALERALAMIDDTDGTADTDGAS